MLRTFGLSGGFWLGPVLLGLALIAIGVAIWVDPRLLSCAVAFVLISTGAMLIGTGLQMRTQVTYRRMDGARLSDDDPL
ncbi:MAG: hypothetical protein JNG88_04180 [Phycisphaerales bacterium]|nr:hypothetical protein [Phycisphaerales bacterium]